MEKVTITGHIDRIESLPNSVCGNAKFRIHLGHVSGCFIIGEQKHITDQVVVETQANSMEASKISSCMEGKVARFECHITPKRRTNIIDSFSLNTPPELKRMELVPSDIGKFRIKFNSERSFEPYEETMQRLTDRVERIRNNLRGDK